MEYDAVLSSGGVSGDLACSHNMHNQIRLVSDKNHPLKTAYDQNGTSYVSGDSKSHCGRKQDQSSLTGRVPVECEVTFSNKQKADVGKNELQWPTKLTQSSLKMEHEIRHPNANKLSSRNGDQIQRRTHRV